jgi:transposase
MSVHERIDVDYQKEQRRLMVLNWVREGRLVGRQAAETLELSLRQVRRLLAGYRVEGARALAHGNRGRKPHNALNDSLKQKVAILAATTYAGCNTQHFTELMADKEETVLSRSTVRRILRSAGIAGSRKRRAPRHRSRRERYPQEGQLLQLDGSRHDWLEGRGPYLTLVGAVDDATGKVPYAVFREQEDTQGYFLMLREIVSRYGVPVAVYHDRHSIFEFTTRGRESIEEQLEGKRHLSHFGRLVQELGITSISANSPQAKGRVERLWGTFQDRLVSELRLAGIATLEEANRVLWQFLPRHNRRFAVPPAVPGSAFAALPVGFDPERVFCFKYERSVSVDNVVRLGEHRLQIMPSAQRSSYARTRVEVHERMDGSLAVYYQGQCLATKQAPAEAPVLRSRSGKARIAIPKTAIATISDAGRRTALMGTRHPGTSIPGPHHPWRRPFKAFVDKRKAG